MKALRLALTLLAVAMVAPAAASAALPNLGPAPWKECGGLFGEASSGCVASEPLAMDDTQVGDVKYSPHVVRVGDQMTLSLAWTPGWRPTSFPTPGTPVTPCPAPPLDATSWSCTMTMNSATNAYVRTNVPFCCFNAREQDYFAVISEGRVIEGTVMTTHPSRPDRLVPAVGVEVAAKSGSSVYRAITNKAGVYELITDDGEGEVRTAGRHCVKSSLPATCKISQSIGTGNQHVDFETPLSHKISGIVRNVSDQPIAGITVHATSSDGSKSASNITATDGKYEMYVPTGSATLSTDSEKVCTDPLTDTCQREKTVDVQAPVTQDWRRTEKISVSGTITEGADKRPVKNIEVRGGGDTGTSDEDGKYELEIDRGSASDRVNVQAGETGKVYRVAGGSDCRAAEAGCDIIPTADRKVDFQKSADPKYKWNVVGECTSPDQGCEGGAHIELSLDGTLSEPAPGRSIVGYDWDVGGVKASGDKVKINLPNSNSVPAELTTTDNEGEKRTTRRVITECDGKSENAEIEATKPSFGPCFGLRVKVSGRKITGDVVGVSMVVSNSSQDKLTGLEFADGIGLRFARGQNILAFASGPNVKPPTELAPGESKELKYAFQVKKDGSVTITGAVSASTEAGRTMTASSVVKVRVRTTARPGEPEEQMINGDLAQRHIEAVRRSGEQEQNAAGIDIARKISGDRNVKTSANEQLMAELLGKSDDHFAWMDEAAKKWRGPDGEKLTTNDIAEAFIAGYTSKGAIKNSAAGAKQAVKDLISLPDQYTRLIAGAELDYLTKIGGIMLNQTNPDAQRYLTEEAAAAKQAYITDTTRRAADYDAFGVVEGINAWAQGDLTADQAFQFMRDKAARNTFNSVDKLGRAYDGAYKFSKAEINRAARDPIGWTEQLGEKAAGVEGYFAADAALNGLTGGAYGFAKAKRLDDVARRLEALDDKLFRGFDTATDARRLADLPAATLPPLNLKDLEGLVGFDAIGYNADDIARLQKVTRDTEAVIGSAERGKRLLVQVKESNAAAAIRERQGVSSPKSQVVANKTGQAHETRFGLSEDAVGFANLTKAAPPGTFEGIKNTLARLVAKEVPDATADLQRRALRRAEYDEFFSPNVPTRTGNRAFDAEVAAQREGLQGKMAKLRQATSAQGYEGVDDFGNVTRIRLELERTKDGKSILFKTVQHDYGQPGNVRRIGRIGAYQGLDNDLIGFVEEDILTGVKTALPAGVKGKAAQNWFSNGRRAGIPLSDHPQSLDSPDLAHMKGKGGKISLNYTLEALSEADGRRYVERDLPQIMKRLGFKDEKKFREWLDNVDFSTQTIDITSEGAKVGTGFAPR